VVVLTAMIPSISNSRAAAVISPISWLGKWGPSLIRIGISRSRPASSKRTPPTSKPQKRIWIDEFGWPVKNTVEEKPQTYPPVTPEVQAELISYVINMIEFKAEDWKIDRLFYYRLADSPGGGEWDENTGLLDDKGVAREGFGAFKAAVEK
jgi:hypothetical protein